jgi:hypothetical protein
MRARTLLFAISASAALTCGFIGQKDGFRHYKDENDAAQAKLEGKAPPPIISSEWLNSKPLSWSALKGKVVLLDMWAYW